MSRMFSLLLFPLLLFVFFITSMLTGCGAKKKPATVIPASVIDTVTMTSSSGYTIDVPKTWNNTVDSQSGNILSASPSTAGDTFAENINTLIEPLPTTMSIDSYCEASVKTVSNMFKNLNIEKKEDFAGKSRGKKLVWTMNSQQLNIKIFTYLFVKGTKGYVVTGSATPETGAEFEPIFDQVAGSLYIQ